MTRIFRWHGWVAVALAVIVGTGPANAQDRPDRLIVSVSVDGHQVPAGEANAIAGETVTVRLIGWLDVTPPTGRACGARSVAIAHAPIQADGYPAQIDPYVISEQWTRYGGMTLQWRPTPGSWDVEVRTLVLCDYPATLRLTTDHPVHDTGERFPEGTAFLVVAPITVVVR
jgi:hypothetical protein